jgi:transcriptional regulator GlxA family with amidase domain
MGGAPRFVIYVYDGVEPVDLGATYGTLSMARRIRPDLQVTMVADKAGPVTLASGMVVMADHGFADCPPSDFLIISGGPGWPEQAGRSEVASFISQQAPNTVVASVCTGAMILAETGLLDGLKVTTKKNVSPGETSPMEILARSHPAATVINALLVDTGPIVTGGGVTLAIDTTLHLLARSIGQEMAEETARLMEYDQAWRVNRETRKTVAVDHGVG